MSPNETIHMIRMATHELHVHVHICNAIVEGLVIAWALHIC